MADHITMMNLNTKKAKFGCCCMFVPLDSKRGVKLYTSKEERDISYFRQKKASKLGLGPKVFKRFSYREPIEVIFQYGYVTEVAKQGRLIWNDYNPKLVKLKNKLEYHGFDTGDVIGPNIGYIGKKLVCIDFDEGSMG